MVKPVLSPKGSATGRRRCPESQVRNQKSTCHSLSGQNYLVNECCIGLIECAQPSKVDIVSIVKDIRCSLGTGSLVLVLIQCTLQFSVNALLSYFFFFGWPLALACGLHAAFAGRAFFFTMALASFSIRASSSDQSYTLPVTSATSRPSLVCACSMIQTTNMIQTALHVWCHCSNYRCFPSVMLQPNRPCQYVLITSATDLFLLAVQQPGYSSDRIAQCWQYPHGALCHRMKLKCCGHMHHHDTHNLRWSNWFASKFTRLLFRIGPCLKNAISIALQA